MVLFCQFANFATLGGGKDGSFTRESLTPRAWTVGWLVMAWPLIVAGPPSKRRRVGLAGWDAAGTRAATCFVSLSFIFDEVQLDGKLPRVTWVPYAGLNILGPSRFFPFLPPLRRAPGRATQRRPHDSQRRKAPAPFPLAKHPARRFFHNHSGASERARSGVAQPSTEVSEGRKP